MKAAVVYESFWGNTAAVARAIAAGIGPRTLALPTGEATPEALEGADLLVVGSPVIAFRLPTDTVRRSLTREVKAPRPPDLSQPSLASWLAALRPGAGAAAAAFDTRAKGPWGSAAPAILKALQKAGCRSVAKPRGFIVTGKYGPLREGELHRAREWGEELVRLVR